MADICCGLYRGTFYARDLGNPSAGLLSLGNAEATINQEMEEITVENFQSLGGNACSVTFPSSYTLDLTLHCMSPKNLAMAFLGEAYQKNNNAVIDEEHVAHSENELIAFAHVPNHAAQDIIVTNEAGTVTYQLNTDYVLANAGLKIMEGSSIVMGDKIKVSYTYGDNWVIDTQTTSQKTFEIVLDGMNVGEDGGERPVVLKAWRVKMSPTDSFTLIGSEFAQIEITGEILRDNSKVTGSPFMQIEFGDKKQVGY